MQTLLLDNLAQNQAFDAALKNGAPIRQISNAYVEGVLLQPNGTKRDDAIAKLQTAVVKYFDQQVQPAARKIGDANATKILNKLKSEGVAPDLNDTALRQKTLIDGAYRPQIRVAIVRHLVNDQANTLSNRLAAYWLEPGANATEKVKRLAELHKTQTEAEARYQQQLAEYYEKKRSRPAKPRVDFLARFQDEATGAVRTQGRRAGTDAETLHFEKAGYQQLAWVTVNASEACPDCRALQGTKGDAAFWNGKGRPGSGHTVCGTACFCMLVPAETLHVAPDLRDKGLVVPPPPPKPAPPKPTPPRITPPTPPPAPSPTTPVVKSTTPVVPKTPRQQAEDAHAAVMQISDQHRTDTAAAQKEFTDSLNDRDAVIAKMRGKSDRTRAKYLPDRQAAEQRVKDAEARRIQVEKDATTKVRSAIDAPRPSKMRLTGDAKLTSLPAVQEGHERFASLIGEGSSLDRLRVDVVADHSGRAHAEPGAIYIGASTPAKIVAHEYAHTLEFADRAVHDACIAFRDRRAAGERPKKLNQILPGSSYGDREIAVEDQFFDPYCGKVYPQAATEILSMGIQRMVSDPIEFAREDPDYFKFIVETLRTR